MFGWAGGVEHMTHNRILASHVLMDLDRTFFGVTDGSPGTVDGYMNFKDTFDALWREYNPGQTAPPDLAGRGCLFAFAASEGIPEDVLLPRLLQYLRMVGLHIHPDAEEFAISVRHRGFAVCAATGAYRKSTMAKLSSVGVMDRDGAPYFERIFTGDFAAGGKNSERYYAAILEDLKVQPDDVVVVGDNMEADAAYAYGAGIRQIVIVERESPTLWTRGEYGALIVSDLTVALDWLSLPEQPLPSATQSSHRQRTGGDGL